MKGLQEEEEMKRLLTPFLSFLLGACAATVVQSTAGTTEQKGDTKGVEAAQAAPAVSEGVQKGLVVAAEGAVRRRSPSGKAVITILAQGENAFTGILRMEGGAAVPEHQDVSEEYIYVLEGGGTVTIEGTEHTVGAGTLIYMPSNARVSFQNGTDPLVAFQVFAGPASAEKYTNWPVVQP